MYFPESKISKNQFTKGNEFVLKDTGEYYNGIYCSLSDGRFFTGKTFTNLSKELLKPKDNKNLINFIKNPYTKLVNNQKILNQEELKSFILKPTDQDYQKGFINRYFAKKLNQNNIFEISSEDYNSVNNKEGKFYTIYQVLQLNWKIIGPIKDNLSNPSLPIYGVEDTNKRTIDQKEKEMRGIGMLLNNLTEFIK